MRWAVVDLTGKKTARELEAYATAQQIQLREQYAACFDGDGVDDAVRVIVNETRDLCSDESPIRIYAAAPSGQDGALGVHDRLPDGRPVCNVFDDLATKYGDMWQSIASHEVLEARADPRLHACVELDDGTIWDREVCDRVEADSYPITVTVDGVAVDVPMSNFNTPECFEPPDGWQALVTRFGQGYFPRKGDTGGVFDWLGKSTTPNEVRPGGYAQKFDPERGWTQVGEMRRYRATLAARCLSRGARRMGRLAP